MAVDKFQIHPFFRFLLVLRVLAPLAFLGFAVWALYSLYIPFSEWGPLILLGLAGWAIWKFIPLFRWFAFSVELSDEGITISGAELKWADLASVHAKKADQFDTFIELSSKDGRTFKIPKCVSPNLIVLAKIEKHFPGIQKETGLAHISSLKS